MTSRPLVTIQNPNKKKDEVKETTVLPAVLTSPLRYDIVRRVHTHMSRSSRQPYAVAPEAGMQTAAESWGTGRAVSRIPRVPGGGTHRAGQGAFGNMCRGGRMFAPTKVYRKWFRKTNKNQRRYALCTALAATAVPALVMARGHHIEKIAEIPLVVADSVLDNIHKTKDAVKLLQRLGVGPDLKRVKESKHIRAGKGKARNRRYQMALGPLIIHKKHSSVDKPNNVVLAFRNIPGVTVGHVRATSLLHFAPGGHLGRFVIWSESAFKYLNTLFGTAKVNSKVMTGFRPPLAKVTNSDVNRIFLSDEVQKCLRDRIVQKRFTIKKKNPLRNWGAMVKLNPHVITKKRAQLKLLKSKKDKKKVVKRKRTAGKKFLKMLHDPAIPPVRTAEEIAPRF